MDLKARRELMRNLQDQPLEAGDPRYYSFHEAPGSPRGLDPVGEMGRTISVAAAVSRELPASGAAGPFERFWGFLRDTQIGLPQPELGGGPAKLKFELARDPDFKLRVQTALRGRLQKVVEEFTEFMAGARQLLKSDLSPVLIVDDLERLRGSGKASVEVQESVRQPLEQRTRVTSSWTWTCVATQGERVRSRLVALGWSEKPRAVVASPWFRWTGLVRSD